MTAQEAREIVESALIKDENGRTAAEKIEFNKHIEKIKEAAQKGASCVTLNNYPSFDSQNQLKRLGYRIFVSQNFLEPIRCFAYWGPKEDSPFYYKQLKEI